jgi:hypothetical protein
VFTFENGVLSMKVEGENLGVVFSDIECSIKRPVFPAIYLFIQGDEAIVNYFHVDE